MNLISKIANISTYIFLILTLILTGICVISIWGESSEVIGKTFASMGLVAFAFFVVLAIDGSGHFRKSIPASVAGEYVLAIEWFVSLRKISFFVVIISVTVSVFLGLLSIWDLLNGDVLFKTLATILSAGFYALITIMVCKQRETALKSITVEQSIPVATASVPIINAQPTTQAPVARF
jgi:hypothetical protein